MALSAAQVGERLLGEVEESKLDELLYSLRALDDPQGGTKFNMPCLDRIVEVFAANNGRPSLPVVDITSATPGAGATHLVYYLTALAVLPDPSGRRSGNDGAAVVLDLDGRFDVARLAQVMLLELTEDRNQLDEDDVHTKAAVDDLDTVSVINRALGRVHIFRPATLASLIPTVDSIPRYLVDWAAEHSQDCVVQLLAVDGVTAFFWQQLMSEEKAKLESLGHEGGRSAPADEALLDLPYKLLVDSLRHAQAKLGCPIVATSSGLQPSTATPQRLAASLAFRPLLPRAWQSFCTLRLVVARDLVQKFAECMTYERARLDAETRQAVVDEGKFSCWVDQWGGERWSEDVWRSLRDDERSRGFAFRITGDGVRLIDNATFGS